MTHNLAEIIKILLSNKVITPSDVVDSGIQLQNDERDRFVLSTLFIGGQPSFMVKRARYPNALESLRQELDAYHIIAKHSELDFITPALELDALKLGFFVMQWKDTTTQANLIAPSDMGHLGSAMGRLHGDTRKTAGSSAYVEQPWVLSCLSDRPRWKPAELDTVITRTDQVDTLRQGLAYASNVWSPDALVHGDLKREHCLLSPDESNGMVCILDWELAGFGDPAWDVASVISDILFNTQYGSDVLTDPVHDIVQKGGNVQAFLQSYVVHRPVNGDFMLRVALYTAARLFQTSLESAALFGADEESGVDGLLFMAAQVLHAPQEFAMRLCRLV